ncbi:MAG: class I SAM-dependent methyltransferase [Pseudonocardiaceae bacterium]
MVGGAGWVAEKFDRRAASYDQSASHRWQAQQAVEFLAPARGERVLDVATGTGLAAREAVGLLGPDGFVVGTDISAGMLRVAREAAGGQRCWFVQADAAAAPFRSGVFDAVACVAGVSYLPDPTAALVEWGRVCRATGRAVVTTPPVEGITTARVLRQAAADEGMELVNPGGPLADPVQRAQVLAAAGWAEQGVDEVVFEQPRSEPDAAFGWVDSGFAEPVRTAPPPVRERVRVRFEARYRAESVEQHRVLLLRLVPSSS